MSISEKQWKLINSIALQIHLTDDLTKMRKDFLDVLGMLVGFERASFYLATEDSPYSYPIGYNLTDEELSEYVNSYAEIDPFIPLIGIFTENNSAIRSSDYIIGRDIECTEFYNLVWKPKKIRYSLLIPLCIDKIWLGAISLYRHDDSEDFSDEDIEIATVLKEHMQARIWRERTNITCHADNIILGVRQPQAECVQLTEYGLTPRESEVAMLWSHGYTDDEICEKLAISRNTLKKHISNIFGKLNITSRVELLKYTSKE